MKDKIKSIAKMIIREFYAHFWINIAVIAGIFGYFGAMAMFVMYAFYDRLCKIEKAVAPVNDKCVAGFAGDWNQSVVDVKGGA